MKFITAIDRYILRLVLMPMLGIFLLAASLLVMDKMLRLFDFVATEGGPVGVVFKMLANMLPEYASLAIPLGLMLGILLAFRKLATSSELDVMRAVGLSYTRMLRVPYIITLGRFLALKDQPDTIILRLQQGQIIQDMPGKMPRVLSFTRHDLPIELPAIEQFRQRGGQEREYLLPELLKLGWNKNASPEERVSSQANFSYRMVEVVMMLLLPLLAVALAIPPKRSTSALGLFVSIVMVVAYHKVNQYANDVASLGKINPILGLWGPFLVFAAMILWMYWRVAYVPGGQPLGWLETASDKVVKRLKSLLRRNRRGPILPTPADQT